MVPRAGSFLNHSNAVTRSLSMLITLVMMTHEWSLQLRGGASGLVAGAGINTYVYRRASARSYPAPPDVLLLALYPCQLLIWMVGCLPQLTWVFGRGHRVGYTKCPSTRHRRGTEGVVWTCGASSCSRGAFPHRLGRGVIGRSKTMLRMGGCTPCTK